MVFAALWFGVALWVVCLALGLYWWLRAPAGSLKAIQGRFFVPLGLSYLLFASPTLLVPDSNALRLAGTILGIGLFAWAAVRFRRELRSFVARARPQER